MRKVFPALLCLAPLVAIAGEPLSKFGWFADMVGSCWKGTLPDGVTEHSHCYSGQFDQFIRGTATLSAQQDGKRVEQFQGDSLFAWDDENREIIYYIWGSNGSHSRHKAMYADGDLAFPIESKKEPGRIAHRPLRHRIDNDPFEVRREVPDGDGWKTELTVLYRRSPGNQGRTRQPIRVDAASRPGWIRALRP
ncbi:hypothetical protein GCM10027084_22980 [Pseudoxanthomonas sangjuensis]